MNMNNIITMHEKRAMLFCETYGITEYKVKGNQLIYYRNSAIAQGIYKTYKHTVNLDTMQENVVELKRLNKEGFRNR